ncbi:hypothetical protein T02_1016 [Trichinella nativa]|uniref:Uncharacterized protein n=1 Tax=Trichinella nativa TaxID=6335 RepID=A0A0V1L6R9_9BILA|nr:hypothetical protein T02_1016 [Trichinella nativa]
MFIQHANQSKVDQLRLTSAFHHRKPMRRRPVLIAQHVVWSAKVVAAGQLLFYFAGQVESSSSIQASAPATGWLGVGLAFTFCPLQTTTNAPHAFSNPPHPELV